MTQTEQQTERLLDALAFVFVSLAVRELGVRPTPHVIALFRARVAAAIERDARGPFGDGDEPTEPLTSRRSRQ